MSRAGSRILVGAALAAVSWACTPDQPSEVEDFHFIEGTFDPSVGPDGNTLVFRATDGLVVVDAGRHRTHSQKILDYAAEQGLPITTIINTHWHLDHATGNQDLKAVYPNASLHTTRAVEGALDGFLAAGAARTEQALSNPDLSDADRARMERGSTTIRERTSLIPDVPVSTSVSLPVVGRDLQLNVTDHAVTESDVWIWDPATRTVVAGDLVTLPAPLFDTACPTGWLAALDAIEAEPYERVIPGHGFPMDPEEFRSYRAAFDNLVTCAGDNAGAICAEGWLADAGPLLDKAAGKDYGDEEYARAAVTYYVDEIIRSEERRAELCPA
jgi:glyoxylase-like metal-dependent hydrolase (beta-lactamase superfamily II)